MLSYARCSPARMANHAASSTVDSVQLGAIARRRVPAQGLPRERERHAQVVDVAGDRRVVRSGVVAASGLTENGWIPVNAKNLKTRFPGVYAIGDVTSVGTAKAGTFSEGAARVVAASVLAELHGGEQPPAYAGAGTCYIEFGGGRVGRVDVDFLSGPAPAGSFIQPSVALVGEKQHFGSSRRARWFGL